MAIDHHSNHLLLWHKVFQEVVLQDLFRCPPEQMHKWSEQGEASPIWSCLFPCEMYLANSETWVGTSNQKRKSSHLFCATLTYCKCMTSVVTLLHLYLLAIFTPLHFTYNTSFIERIIFWKLTRFGSLGSFPIVVKEMYWKKRFKRESKLEDREFKCKYKYKEIVKHKYKYLIKSPVALPVHHRDEVGVSAGSGAIGQALVEIPRKSIGLWKYEEHSNNQTGPSYIHDQCSRAGSCGNT